MRKDFLVNTAKHKMYVLKDCVKVRNPRILVLSMLLSAFYVIIEHDTA